MKPMKPADKANLIEWVAIIVLLTFALVLHSQFKSNANEYRKNNPKIQNVNLNILKHTSDKFYIRNH